LLLMLLLTALVVPPPVVTSGVPVAYSESTDSAVFTSCEYNQRFEVVSGDHHGTTTNNCCFHL
jgi:hypothetical protein